MKNSRMFMRIVALCGLVVFSTFVVSPVEAGQKAKSAKAIGLKSVALRQARNERVQKRLERIRKARQERIQKGKKTKHQPSGKQTAKKSGNKATSKAHSTYQQRMAKLENARAMQLKQRQQREKLRISLRKELAKAKGAERAKLRQKLNQVTFSRDAANQEVARREAAAKKAAAARAARATGGKGYGKRSYSGLIAKHASARGVPIGLAHAVVFSESGYRANARGRAGEIGLMQLKLSTARGVGYRGSAKGLYNPDTNLRYGMIYLARAYHKAGGNVCRTILKYNAGHGATRMNPTSQRYCNKVRRIMGRSA